MSYCIPVIEFHQQIHWNDWTKALLLREMSPLEDCTHLKNQVAEIWADLKAHVS